MVAIVIAIVVDMIAEFCGGLWLHLLSQELFSPRVLRLVAEAKCGLDGPHDRQDKGAYYGEGCSLLPHHTMEHRVSTVLYLAVVVGIIKCAPYSRNLVRGCVMSFPAFTNKMKSSAALL